MQGSYFQMMWDYSKWRIYIYQQGKDITTLNSQNVIGNVSSII